MTTQRNKYLHITDCHTKTIDRHKLLAAINSQEPKSVFLTGDMSEGFAYLSDLEYLGQNLKCPMLLIHGNHEAWWSSFAKLHDGISKLTAQYPNLIWMTDAGIVKLNDETCAIGIDGLWDARIGNKEYIEYTIDWRVIEDFSELPTMKARIKKMRQMADDGAEIMSSRLEEALETYRSVYLLTHVPCWEICNQAKGWFNQKFLKPYNTNYVLGETLEKVMSKHKKKSLTVLCGHHHYASITNITKNIECRVGAGGYSKIGSGEIIFI